MEKSVQGKTIEWPTIIEFFTKRGRPLTKQELEKLKEEDRLLREEEEEKKRNEEEVERRRQAKFMRDLEENEDSEEKEALEREEEELKRMEEELQKKMRRMDEFSDEEGGLTFDQSEPSREFDDDEDSDDNISRESYLSDPETYQRKRRGPSEGGNEERRPK